MNLHIPATNWWKTDSYPSSAPLPDQLLDPSMSGPKGPALVRVFPGGSTQKGWGLTSKDGPGFMENYDNRVFDSKRALRRFEVHNTPFALVTRSVRAMVVDIDGKNGGLHHASAMGALPLTLAETSKSGNGYHLFYEVDDSWDRELGFGLIPDQIGIVQGVDIRGVGCVYHYDTQRWNNRPMAQLPGWLQDRLLEKKQQREAQRAQIAKIDTLDETEKLVMHAELLDELKKPIPAGRRNTTLFAIGGQLKEAEVDDWQKHLSQKAYDVGLDGREVEKLISNIENYG